MPRPLPNSASVLVVGAGSVGSRHIRNLLALGPVPDFNVRRRSFALPEFDPFWEAVQQADVMVGLHASDSGFQRYLNDFEGTDGEFEPFKGGRSAFTVLVNTDNRMITDIVSSIIGHGFRGQLTTQPQRGQGESPEAFNVLGWSETRRVG